MSLLSDLATKHPHHLSPVFKRFSRTSIAKKLGVTPNFLSSVMTGCNRPSTALEERMQNLANQILEAEQEDKNI